MTFIDASAPIATHAAIKQNVHGVGANDIADVADISTHAAVTTNIHGTGAGNVVVGDDEVTALAALFPSLTVAQFQANAATGIPADADELNDNDTDTTTSADAIGEYYQVLFDHPAFIREFRQYGSNGNNGDGVYKIQIKQDGGWVDNTLAIPVRVAHTWSDWSTLTTPAYTQGFRLVVTFCDTSMGANFIRQLELRG